MYLCTLCMYIYLFTHLCLIYLLRNEQRFPNFCIIFLKACMYVCMYLCMYVSIIVYVIILHLILCDQRLLCFIPCMVFTETNSNSTEAWNNAIRTIVKCLIKYAQVMFAVQS